MSRRNIVIGLLAALVLLVAAPAAMADSPAWSIAATHSPATFAEASTGNTHTITVTNVGTAPTSGSVTVKAVTGTGISRTATTAAGWTCSYTSGVNLNTCTRSDALAAGADYPPIVLTTSASATAGVGAGMRIVGSYVVSGGGGADASTTDTVPITGTPNYTMQNYLKGSWRQGDVGAVFTTQIVNQGGAPTSGSSSDPIVVTLGTPPVGMTVTAMSGGGWTCTLTATTAGGVSIPANSCYRTNVIQSSEEMSAISVTVNLAGNAPAATRPTIRAYGGGSTQTAVAPLSTTPSFNVAQAADLNVTSAHTGSWKQGGEGTYALTVKNVVGANSTSGGASVGTITVTDVLPAGLTATAMSGSGWTCTLQAGPLPGNPATSLPANTCIRTTALAVNATSTINVTARIDPTTGSSVANQATVSGGGMIPASMVDGLQTTSDVTAIDGVPDLVTYATHSGPFVQGDGSGAGNTLTITPQNVGGADTFGAEGVTVSSTLPSGLTPLSVSAAGWVCTIKGQQVDCITPNAIASGVSATPIVVTTGVTPGAPGGVIHEPTTTGGGQTYRDDDGAYDQVTIGQKPDLHVDVTDTGGFRQAGTGSGYDLVVSNSTHVDSTGTITVVATPGAGLTVTGLSGNGWTCNANTLTCTRTGAVHDAAPPIRVAVDVGRTAPATVTTSAAVSGGGQLVTSNDTGTLTTDVAQVAAAACAAQGPAVQTAYGAATDVALTCTGSGIAYAVTGGPGHGSVGDVAAGVVRYTPASGFSGTDTFAVTATNVLGETATQTVTVTVAAQPLAPPTPTTPTPPPAPKPPAPKPPAPKPVAPKSVSLHVSGITSTKTTFGFKVKGVVKRPPSVSASKGCAGTVRLVVKRGSKTVATRTTKLSRSCTYSSAFRLSKKTVGRSGKLKVTARFSGNKALKARSTAARTISIH